MAAAQIEVVNTKTDKVKVGLSAVLLLGSLVAFYYLKSQDPLLRWGVLVGGLLLAVVLFFVSEHGRQLVAFGRDAWREVNKVVWPTHKERVQVTAYVFAFVVVMALFLWGADQFLGWVIYDLLLGWRG